MEPVQFNEWHHEQPVDIAALREEGLYTEEELAAIVQPDPTDPDWFDTLDGSNHSAEHCGCKLVSERYAQWFIAYEMWQWYHFFTKEKVLTTAPWVRDPIAGKHHYTRTTSGGLNYNYRREHGSYMFLSVSMGTFVYYNPRLGHLRPSAWELYEAYIKHRCTVEGIAYEGY
jgi:hypothetical protein